MKTVTRRHRFEAAHRLTSHKGKCKFLHGHSYVVEVSISSCEPKKGGMVLDFGTLKTAMVHVIDDGVVRGHYTVPFDHSLILWQDDLIAGEVARIVNDQPVVFTIEEPTAEYMALLLADLIQKELFYIDSGLYGKIWLSKIQLWETENSYATLEFEEPDDDL